jgi:FecR-like protein
MNAHNDSSIETLIRHAGEREMPSAEGMQRAREAAHAAWRRTLDEAPVHPRRWHRWLPLAGAAAAAIVAVVLFFWRPEAAAPVRVAQVVASQGPAPLAAGTEVFSGTTLSSGDGRIAALIPGGLSLRLDRHTRLRFDGREHVTLLEGSVYVDSGGLNAGPPLAIGTPAGDVSHVGTQFQVSVAGQTTRVQVREGRVSLEPAAGGRQLGIAAGDALEVRGREEHWQRGLASYGSRWEWATSLAQPLAIEDRPLAEFLAWLSREHGWQVTYADDALQQHTHEVRLHGSFEGLDTAAMLERVTLVTGVPLEVRDGALWVGERR